MPCWMRGQIKLTDFERLQIEAKKSGLLLVEDSTKSIVVWKGSIVIARVQRNELMTGGKSVLKDIMKSYTTQKIKMAAQKKGWKVRETTNTKGELVLTVSE